MKHLKISGNIVLDNHMVAEFKKELDELMKRYSKTNLSYNCKITSTQNINNVSKPKKYKAGQVYKMNIENDTLDYHILFLSIGETICTAAILSKDALDNIKKYGKRRHIQIEPYISNLYFIEDISNLYFIEDESGSKPSKSGSKLLYDLRTYDENNKKKTIDIDSIITFVEDLDDAILANIIAKLKSN